jgi:ABC-type taurine transport system ATPase subunit
MTQKDNLLPWRNVRDNIAFPLELAGLSGRTGARAEVVIKGLGSTAFKDVFRANYLAECESASVLLG